MINVAKKLSLILVALLALPPFLFAQGERSIDMAETMRSEGEDLCGDFGCGHRFQWPGDICHKFRQKNFQTGKRDKKFKI
jgi:hypothetical protein